MEISGFRVKEFLAENYNSSVFKTDKNLAVKHFLIKDLNYHIIQELNVAFNIKHPNIISFLNIKITKQEICLVMELADKTLVSLIENENLSGERKKDLCFDIVKGLDFLHHNLITHRDLHIGNIVVKEGKVKIIDFGGATKICSYYENFPICLNEFVEVDHYSLSNLIHFIWSGKFSNLKLDQFKEMVLKPNLIFDMYEDKFKMEEGWIMIYKLVQLRKGDWILKRLIGETEQVKKREIMISKSPVHPYVVNMDMEDEILEEVVDLLEKFEEKDIYQIMAIIHLVLTFYDQEYDNNEYADLIENPLDLDLLKEKILTTIIKLFNQ